MVSDNISDITYRPKSCVRRGCCEERDKIMNQLEKKNRKKAQEVRKSSIIEARGGKGQGLGGGNLGRTSSLNVRTGRCPTPTNNRTMTASEMGSIMHS